MGLNTQLVVENATTTKFYCLGATSNKYLWIAMAVTLIEKQHSCKGFPKNQHTLNKDHLDGYSCWGAEKHAEKLKENSKKKT